MRAASTALASARIALLTAAIEGGANGIHLGSLGVHLRAASGRFSSKWIGGGRSGRDFCRLGVKWPNENGSVTRTTRAVLANGAPG